MEPSRQENDTATQVPSQETEDKSQRSTPSERTISTMTPPNDEVLLSSDTATDLNHPTGSSLQDYVDWYVNVSMSKEQRAVWDSAQILDFLESVEAFKAKGQHYRITLTFFMDAQQLATDMDMDLSDAVDVYLGSWVIDDVEDEEWLIESTNIDEKWDDEDDWHSWSLIEWICDMVKEENDFVLAFLIEQHQLFTDDLTTSMQE